jgi:sigma-E factor negative regulatory protein RseA
MTDQLKQQLSALMDGELGRDEARFLHKRLENDADLRADWARWHCVRDSLQGRPLQLAGADFLAGVTRGIEQDAAPARAWMAGGLRWMAGAAVAASVAVVALMALPNAPTGGTEGIAAQPATPDQRTASRFSISTGCTAGRCGLSTGMKGTEGSAAQPATPVAEVVTSGLHESDLRPSLAPVAQSVSRTQGIPLSPAVQIDPRLEAWLIRHNAATAQPGQDSFVPFIPVLSPHRPAVQPVLIENREAVR